MIKYRGIVIFGAPGSGKTTIARMLAGELPRAKYVEASELVVRSAWAVKENMAKAQKGFIRAVDQRFGKRTVVAMSRQEGRDFFTLLKNKYSSDIIARTVRYLHKKHFPQKLMILAGIRGYANSLHFKKAGYLVLYLKTPEKYRIKRLAKRENYSKKMAQDERQIEERLFSTNMVEKIAHLTFNTAVTGKRPMLDQIKALLDNRECGRCANSSVNLSGTIGRSGLCDVCEKYENNFDRRLLDREFKFLLTLKGTGKRKYDALVGISGGKDSTATLYEVKKMGFTPLAFSLDTGYYPKHIYPRAKKVAGGMGVEFKRFDVRKYIRPADRASFRKTAELYDEKESEELREKFRKWYIEGRRHYSIKCRHAIPFVRTCQLCRRLTIRAYYDQAVRHGVRAVILGINEWAGLSQDPAKRSYRRGAGSGFRFSGVRCLKPFKNRPAVYVVHLPFLLQRRIGDTRRILKSLGWKIPRGEELIESNANSCLFARAAESKAWKMLGFHPDTTRLSREVTVGFITKWQARKALAKNHHSPLSVRKVLERAKIL